MNKSEQTKMLKRFLTMAGIVLVTAASSQVNAQNGVGINPTGAAADPSAALDVSATNKGVLVPRMTEAEKVAIASPANGLLIFQTDGVSGFWYYNATTSAWMPIAGSQLPTSLTGLIIGNGTSAMTGLSGTNSGETINWNNTTGTWQVTGTSSLALGNNAGQTTQGQSAVAVGTNAGQTSQAANSVAIGNTAGQTTQGQSAVAMGSFAGSMNQGVNSIAMGNNAGGNDQGNGAVAIGRSAGYAAQGQSAVAMGSGAGYIAQGQSAVAMGKNAGETNQGQSAVAIGDGAGYDTQGQSAVAIGYSAGDSNQGANSIAIGKAAGTTNQAANSIILNASGVDLNSTTDGLFIKPIRNAASPNVLSYDPISGEVTHSTGGATTTMGPISASSATNGGTINSGVLSLTPADATNGGIVTNGAQTFAGDKTFTGTTTANSFVKTGGTSSQYLMADGSVTAAPAPTNGYSFMPIQNATSTIISGTKSYWYIVRLTKETTINGIQVYLASGSDLMRCAIYRGYVKTGVSGSITLVGQTTNTTVTTGLPYMSKAITPITGQSLTFAAGEYITIAFHSAGSTSSYYQSSSSVVNTEIMYNTAANYASSGFPASLTQTSISSTLTTRLCFELY